MVNWVGYYPGQTAGHPALFAGSPASTCSSAPARSSPGRCRSCPITESSPRRQPVFGYARDKIACEELLADAYRTRASR